MRLFIALFLMVVSVGVARAQSTITQQLATENVPRFSGNAGVSYNSNFARQDSPDSEQSMSSDGLFNYRIKDANLARLYLGVEKEITQGQEWKPIDGYVAWANNAFWGKTKRVTFGQQVRLHIPLSKEARLRDTKYTGVSLVPVVQASLTPSVLFIYQPNLSRNFHTYKVNKLGNKNAEYGLSHSAILFWSITDNLYFQPTFIYRNSWSYGGTRRDPSYVAAGEIGYAIGSGLTLSVGWTNDVAMRRFENGGDTDLQAFDNNTSTFSTSLYWIF
jgi:hypothetical protein